MHGGWGSTIFDVGGRVVRRFALGAAPAGMVVWDGRSGSGRSVPAGLYLARLSSGKLEAHTKLMLLR